MKRPEWLTPRRKKVFASPISRAPSKRREEVLERLLLGWTDRRIAKDLGISYHRARNLSAAVLKQHRAHGRAELIRLLCPQSVQMLGASGKRLRRAVPCRAAIAARVAAGSKNQPTGT